MIKFLTDLEQDLSWAPAWSISLAIFVLASVIALTLFGAVTHLVRRVAPNDVFWRSLLDRTRGPLRLGVLIAALTFAALISPLTNGEATWIGRILVLSSIGLIAWVVQTALNIWLSLYLRRFEHDTTDSILKRKHLTQTGILKRVAKVFIWTAAISAALMTFESVRQYGISLLASAGAAGLVVGLALQPVLKNLLAGIQLAVTQPIRIGDSIFVEGEFGSVEEIRATYIVVRVWDARRLILPLSYFIEQPFQNWTRENPELLGTVMLYLDYSVPIEALRSKAEEIVKASKLWDGRTFGVQVTDFKPGCAEVRVLVSAATSGRAFDLRCEVREKLMMFLQQSHPEALPRQRTELHAANSTLPFRINETSAPAQAH